MDRIKINNQIVVMRKFVKQAKTRIINKYVKEIKLLRNRKGNDNQVLKCKRKADRLFLKVTILKKIRPDSVSKMALSKAKDWKAVLTQKSVSLEDMCFAMLASYESVQKEVEKFHSLNSYLVPRIIPVVQEWEEKSKHSQSPKKINRNFTKDIKDPDVSPQKTETNLNAKDSLYKHKTELGVEKTQQENLLLSSISKRLKTVKTKLIDAQYNASDSAFKNIEESGESEACSDSDKVLKASFGTSSENRIQISRNANKMVKTSLNPCSTNSFSESEDEESRKSLQSDFDSDDGTKGAQGLESKHEPKNFTKAVTLMNSFEDDTSSPTEESEENETYLESDKALKATGSQNMFKISRKDDMMVKNSLNTRDTDSPMKSENEKEEDFSNNSQKDSESENVRKEEQVLKAKPKPWIKNSKNHPLTSIRRSATVTNKPVKSQKSFAVESNSTKAVALLNLNEMLDMDEIPIENTHHAIGTTEESSKRKKDAFFLNDSGEVFESDADEDLEDDQQQRNSPFRKKPYKDFNKKFSNKDHSKNKQNKSYFGAESSHNNPRNKKNSGDSPHTNKLHFRENSFKTNNRNFHPKDRLYNFEENQGRQGGEFYNNRSNNSEKTEGRHVKDFNRNKKFNKIDKKDGIDSKPFKSSVGQNFKKNVSDNSSKRDHNPRSKLDKFNKTAKKDDLPLHPSWEAKRKAKDLVKAKFQGKRVVFND